MIVDTGRRVRKRSVISRAVAADAALTVIASRGFEGARYQDIAKHSGMSIGNLEYLFGSRVEMLRAAFREGARRDTRLLNEIAQRKDDRQARLAESLADTENGLGSGLLVRIELWRAGLRDARFAADATAAADAWRTALATFVPANRLGCSGSRSRFRSPRGGVTRCRYSASS
jgi:AcrR family transcriptional regulator